MSVIGSSHTLAHTQTVLGFVENKSSVYLSGKGCKMKLYQLIAEILREGLGPLRKRITFVRLDDMVFEGREKDYGAYALRRKYPWHLVLALGLVTQLVWLGVFGPVWMYEEKSSPSFSNGIPYDFLRAFPTPSTTTQTADA